MVVPWDAPPVEELLGGRGTRQNLGDHRRVRGARPDEQRRRAVTAVTLVRATGKAGADVRQHDQRRLRRRVRGQQRPHAGAHRTDHVDREHGFVQSQGGVDGRGIGLVQVSRRRRGEVELLGTGRVWAGGDRGPPQRGPRRFHAQGRRVLVIGGHRACAGTPTGTKRGSHGLALEPVVRQVGAVGK